MVAAIRGVVARVSRRAAKVDLNHEAIVLAFRRMGCDILSLAPLGRGAPDLLCATKRATWLVEVKSPKGRLNAEQTKWHAAWPQPVFICRGVEDVARIIQLAHSAHEWSAGS